MLRYFTLIFTLIALNVSAQLSEGAHAVALASTGVVLQSEWSVLNNQAGIATIKKPTVAICYEQRFADKDLNAQSLVFAYPLGKNVIGIGVQKYGINAFNEQKIGLTYARQYGNNLNLALNLNYHQLKIASYGNANAVSAEIGVQYQINQTMLVGAHLSNPGQGSYDAELSAIIPVVMQLGFAYNLSDQVFITTAAEQRLNNQPDFRLGGEYKIVEYFKLRGGVSVNPFKQYVGFGFSYQHMKIDAASASQAVLGYSPQLALSYEF